MTDLDARVALALDVAPRGRARWRSTSGGGGASSRSRRRRALQDIVSEADRSVERLVRDRVAAAFPEDGFLGEEYGAEPGRSGFDLGDRPDRRHLALSARDAELVRGDGGGARDARR